MSDPRIEQRYTIKEISLASGIKVGTLKSRATRLAIKPDKNGYTLQDAKALIKKPVMKKYSLRKVDALKMMLKNDGCI